MEKFEQVDALSMLSMIEFIVADYLVKDSINEGAHSLIRAKIKNIYKDDDNHTTSRGSTSRQQAPTYIEPTEHGYPGLLPPVG